VISLTRTTDLAAELARHAPRLTLLADAEELEVRWVNTRSTSLATSIGM